MIEPTGEVDSVAGEVEEECDLVGCPTDNVSAADHKRRDDSVSTNCVQYWTTRLNTTDETTGINDKPVSLDSHSIPLFISTTEFVDQAGTQSGQSAVDWPIWMKFGTPMQNNTPVTMNRSKSTGIRIPMVEVRFHKTEVVIYSAVDWFVSLVQALSLKSKPEVDFWLYDCHL